MWSMFFQFANKLDQSPAKQTLLIALWIFPSLYYLFISVWFSVRAATIIILSIFSSIHPKLLLLWGTHYFLCGTGFALGKTYLTFCVYSGKCKSFNEMASVYSHDCISSMSSRAAIPKFSLYCMNMSSNFKLNALYYIVKWHIVNRWMIYYIHCACIGNIPCFSSRQDKWASPLTANVSWQVQAEPVMVLPSNSRRPF